VHGRVHGCVHGCVHGRVHGRVMGESWRACMRGGARRDDMWRRLQGAWRMVRKGVCVCTISCVSVVSCVREAIDETRASANPNGEGRARARCTVSYVVVRLGGRRVAHRVCV